MLDLKKDFTTTKKKYKLRLMQMALKIAMQNSKGQIFQGILKENGCSSSVDNPVSEKRSRSV